MFGKTGLLFLAAAAGLRVAQADFIVYTEPPIPTSAIPSFANPSDVINPLPPSSASLTNPTIGRKLDYLRLPQREFRLWSLHKLARLNLQTIRIIRLIRNRRLRKHRIKLQHPRRCDRVRDHDVLFAAGLVYSATERRACVQGTAGFGSV